MSHLSDAGIPDMEIEHNGTQHDSAAMQGAVCTSFYYIHIYHKPY